MVSVERLEERPHPNPLPKYRERGNACAPFPMISGDTIVAISSAVGTGVRMIVRTSGPAAAQLASDIWRQTLPDASHAACGTLSFANLEIPGCWLYVFRSPRSYTGEDLVEFHIPANPLLAR